MTTKVTVTGGNLFRVAADYLNDATQANRIAVANGLTDFFLPEGPTVLNIPDPDPTQTGGIPVAD